MVSVVTVVMSFLFFYFLCLLVIQIFKIEIIKKQVTTATRVATGENNLSGMIWRCNLFRHSLLFK